MIAAGFDESTRLSFYPNRIQAECEVREELEKLRSSALGQNRTLATPSVMSALHPKADTESHTSDVRS